MTGNATWSIGDRWYAEVNAKETQDLIEWLESSISTLPYAGILMLGWLRLAKIEMDKINAS